MCSVENVFKDGIKIKKPVSSQVTWVHILTMPLISWWPAANYFTSMPLNSHICEIGTINISTTVSLYELNELIFVKYLKHFMAKCKDYMCLLSIYN